MRIVKPKKWAVRAAALCILALAWVWCMVTAYLGMQDIKVTGESYAKTYNAAYKSGLMSYDVHYKMYVDGKMITKSISYIQSDWDNVAIGSHREFTVQKNDTYGQAKDFFSMMAWAISWVVFVIFCVVCVFVYLVTDDDGKWPTWME